jgi:CO/xanthine dehydrogenase Mo-binding subunit
MTEMLNKEFSRKSFVKGGGALIVGFSALGASLAGRAQATDSPYASNGPYDMYQVDSWIRIHADNTATILTGAVELGQGTSTGLLQIAGEELDMSFSQLKFVQPDTNLTPDNGRTAGSSSIEQRGPQVRAAAATARQALLGLASKALGAPVASLSVKDGVVSGGGKSITYGDLIGEKLFNVRMPASYNLNPGSPPVHRSGLSSLAPGVKPPSEYKLVGTTPARIDIPAKVSGSYTYVHTIKVPGMLHGRLVRPRGQGAHGDGTNPQIISVDESSIKHIPSARIVQRGNFLGVVAPLEYDAIQAAAQLKVEWAEPPTISGSGNLWKSLRDFDSSGKAPARVLNQKGNVDAAIASSAHVVSDSFKMHYQNHGVIGPGCAVADVTPNGALVMCNSQGQYEVRALLAPLLNLPLNKIRVVNYEGASTFGNSLCRYETSLAAAVMSQLAGKPVRLQLMRWDEHGWDHSPEPMLIDIRAGVDAKGKLTAFDFTQLLPGTYVTNPTEQQVGMPLVTPGANGSSRRLPEFVGNGAQGNEGQLYDFPHYRLTSKTAPTINNYFKVSTMRAVKDPQTFFAVEQTIDALAHMSNMDPLAFRAQNIPAHQQHRWGRVIDALTSMSNYTERVSASNLSSDELVAGRGLSLLPHVEALTGVVADIEVNKATGKIVVKHLYVVQDLGLTINPALAENQMIGAAVMTTSRLLHEEVVFNTKRVTSLDWVTYPILRFKDSPKVTAATVQSIDQVSCGGGEAPVGAFVGSIANAFFDATGVRIHEAPMTPGRVRATLKAAAVK